MLAVGGVALAVAAAWFGRKQIATAARPAFAKAARPLVIQAARRRPLKAARLAATHPREALKLARALAEIVEQRRHEQPPVRAGDGNFHVVAARVCVGVERRRRLVRDVDETAPVVLLVDRTQLVG